jgi:PAS domain S-box-containing protein
VPDQLEARAVLPSGEVRWIDWRMKVKTDANGQRTRVVGFALDISYRKRQELALSEARAEAQTNAERLRMALSAARAGAFELNVEDQIFWSSPEFDEIVGRRMTYAEASMQPWPMNAPEDLDRIREFLPSIEAGDMPPVEWRVVLDSGERRWVRSFARLWKSEDGALQRVVGAILDIDERKRQELALMEAERAANMAAEAKAQFLANMSHEIRTPMNGILGVLHLLEQEGLSSEGQHLLGEAQACGQMLSQLLNDVIDFSKIEAGRLELQPEPMDPADTLGSVVKLLRPQAEAKGLDLRVKVEGDGWITADPVRLRQALFNLIGNAVKFTVEGHVEARLSLHDEGAQRRLRFEIQDTGVGIPKSAQASLFRRFQQADGSTARQFGGSGLGLAITRALAELMGGEVGFTSCEGKGSTFWIEVLADKAAGPETGSRIADGVLEGLRILIVEDNPTNRLVATKMLEALGAQVETANDGLDGVAAVQNGPRYDLVLMDVQMPRMDGMEATRTIRGLPEPLGSTRIIGLTANALSHQWSEYRAVGMDGLAAKPISPPALIGEIARVMNEVGGTRAA